MRNPGPTCMQANEAWGLGISAFNPASQLIQNLGDLCCGA